MARLKLSPPWIIFYREIEALFKDDSEVHIVYDEDENEIKVYVENENKADALMQLLPSEKVFGNVELKITVIPANNTLKSRSGLFNNLISTESLFRAAFESNSAISYVKTVRGIFSNNITYVVFKKKVVQYFNDDLSDINGYCSTLYQEIAKNVFGEHDGIFFCTDVTEPSTICNFGF